MILATLAMVIVLLPIEAVAFKTRVVPGHYIVELDDPPSMRFTGGPVMQLSGLGERVDKPMAATAPAPGTGQHFDVRDAAVQVYSRHLDRERAAVLDWAGFDLGRT